jgi:hypothetical protein
VPAKLPRAEHALGSLGAYRLAMFDAFPQGPAAPASPDPSTWSGTGSGSKLWSWGLSGLSDGTPTHYVNLHGDPDDSPSELLARSGAPAAKLPAGTRLLFHGKNWGKGNWVFGSVAVESAPVLTASDIETCTVADHQYVETTSSGNVITMEPSLEIRWNTEGQRKLASLAPHTGLSVAFGDDALTEAWFPEWSASSWFPSNFSVEALTHEDRVARAQKLAARCTTTH